MTVYALVFLGGLAGSLHCVGMFPRDERVVDELVRAHMIRSPASLPYRREELRWLQSQYGLSDVFGDEVPEILNEMMGTGAEEDGHGGP